eukprot:SAG22_NODE_476_length_9995_cov_9.488480_5_plen_183_part_00
MQEDRDRDGAAADTTTATEEPARTEPASGRLLYWLTAGRGQRTAPTPAVRHHLQRAGFSQVVYVDDWGKLEYAWVGACRGGVDGVLVDAAGQPDVWLQPSALPQLGVCAVLLRRGVDEKSAAAAVAADGCECPHSPRCRGGGRACAPAARAAMLTITWREPTIALPVQGPRLSGLPPRLRRR